MAPAKRDAVLKEVTNAPYMPRDAHDAAAAPGIFKQRPNTVQTFSRKKRPEQVPLKNVLCALLLSEDTTPTLLCAPAHVTLTGIL
jgi:hypothetical protein